jgi:hypothetical protein
MENNKLGRISKFDAHSVFNDKVILFKKISSYKDMNECDEKRNNLTLFEFTKNEFNEVLANTPKNKYRFFCVILYENHAREIYNEGFEKVDSVN